MCNAQTLVSTNPQNKNAIIEEFTGVRCPNCPAGHNIAKSILNDYPGKAFVIAYHPQNSGYTVPRKTTDPDMRRTYPNAFYSSSYVGSRFMPGAMINRRLWNSKRLSGRGGWRSKSETIMNETSPVNIGLKSTYDIAGDELDIDIEVYFTDNVTDPLSLYVYLLEDSLVAKQSNGGNNYVHMHVFREALSAQWGDNVSGPTIIGSLYSTTINKKLNTTLDPLNLDNTHVIAFLYNKSNEEVITGFEVKAKGGTSLQKGGSHPVKSLSVYPNPVEDVLYYELDEELKSSGEIRVSICHISGGEIYKRIVNTPQEYGVLDLRDISLLKGVYLLKIKTEKGIVIRKFVRK
jgi:hypothetical protein